MVRDMDRRYPKYQAGGMPSGVPTDIQRLIRRMLEARTDRAEDVIPDLAYGGIIGLQRGGFLRDLPQGPTFGTVPDYGPRPRGSDTIQELLERARAVPDGLQVIGRGLERDPSQMEESRGPSRLGEYAERIMGGIGQISPFSGLRRLRRAGKSLGNVGERLRDRIAPHIEIMEAIGRGTGRPEDRNPAERRWGADIAVRDLSRRFRDSDIAEKLRSGILQSARRLTPGRFRNPDFGMDFQKNELEGRASGGIVGFQAGGSPYRERMVQSYVSPEVARPYADLTGRIQRAGAQPYTPYGGQRLAATTADQALARAAYGAYGRGAGPAGTQQAAATMGQAGQMLGGAYQGMAGLQPQYAQMAGQFGGAAQGALGQAQADAARLRGAAGTAQMRGDLAAAGMRGTGAAAQAEQQALGVGQAAAGAAGQQQMTGLGTGMGAAGQAALAAQQQFGTGMQGFGAGAAGQAQAREAQAAALGQQAQQAGAAGQAQMAGLGTQAGQLGTQAMGQMGQTGQQSREQAQQAAERMRQIGGQAPQLGKGADLSDYMSQYTAGVTDPQLQQLMEFQRMQGQELGSRAAQAGAFGGSRMGVERGKLAETTTQEASKIIGEGLKEGQKQAVEREREDARRREQAQQTGLTAEQQAAQIRAAAQGQALAAQQAGVGAAQAGGAQQLQAAQQGLAAGQRGSDAQLQALQTGIAAGQFGSEAQMRAQQQAAAMGQAGAGAYQQALAGQGALTGQGIGMGMQGLTAQQAAAASGAQFGLQGQQQGFQAGQAGAQLGMTGLQQAGQLAQQGYGTMGQLLGQQQGALGAQGQAFGQMGQLGGQMGQLGGQQRQLGYEEQRQQLQRLQAMEQAGARTQQEQQRDYDIAHQDFLRQQQYPQQQIGWQLGAMQQLPYQSTQVIGDYEPTPGLASDVAGAVDATAAEKEAELARQRQFPDQGASTTGTDLGIGGATEYDHLDDDSSDADDSYDPYNPYAAGGGYLSSSGILAPYHKKLIDGLYAGGRINY